MKIFIPTMVMAVAGVLTASAQDQSVLDLLRKLDAGRTATTAPAVEPPPAAPATSLPTLDTKPAFMSVNTNFARVTNQVIVTNFVVVTNISFTTNLYNAQGQLLTPVPGSASPAIVAAPAVKAPDPALVRSNQVQAVRDLLRLSIAGTSSKLSVPGSFANNETNQIRIPEGITVFDKKKAQALLTAMNAAAEKAVPASCSIIEKIATQLTPSDPAQVLKGGGNGATVYLVNSEGQNVLGQMLPIVQRAAADAKVPEAYNAAMLRGGGLLGAVLGSTPSVDINAHINKGLMEAIMLNLAGQEGQIRANPAMRTTKSLKEFLP